MMATATAATAATAAAAATTVPSSLSQEQLLDKALYAPTNVQCQMLAQSRNADDGSGGSVERICNQAACINMLKSRTEADLAALCQRRAQQHQPTHDTCCDNVHFISHIQPHTHAQATECQWLDACRDMGRCKRMHWRMIPAVAPPLSFKHPTTSQSAESQWINCDLAKLDMRALGQFDIVMLDPAWSINMELSYALMPDAHIESLPLHHLQSECGGYMFLWVTTRRVAVGRRCLANWGYTVASELLWVKVTQHNQLMDRGTTGHWLNHCKEHLLVGYKRGTHPPAHDEKRWSLGLDADVIVSHPRESSRKPDEIYSIIERLTASSPHPVRKLELFGRSHNLQLGWLTVGNQLGSTHVVDPALRARLTGLYGAASLDAPMLVGQHAQAGDGPGTHNTFAAQKPGFKAWKEQACTTSDLSQQYIDSWHCERPQNYIVASTLTLAQPGVNKFRRAMFCSLSRNNFAPQTLNFDISTALVSFLDPPYAQAPSALVASGLAGCAFNCIVLDPPWLEYEVTRKQVARVPGQKSWTADQIAALPIGQLVAGEDGAIKPACLFFWCGSWPHQYEQACIMLRRWGFELVEEVVWLQTSNTVAAQHYSQLYTNRDAELPTDGVFQSTYERCLVAVRQPNEAKRELPPQERSMPFLNRCCDVDVFVGELPAESRSRKKPDAFYEMVERFCTGTHRLELFAESYRTGWVSVGIENPHFPFDPAAIRAMPATLPYDEQVDCFRPRQPR
jgi:mRNA (2'-O-methyladenosine-N6-)-methyltransferase